MHLALQQVVGQVAHIADIAKNVIDAIFHRLRCDRLITLGQWLEGISVNLLIDLEHEAVVALPWIFFCLYRRGGHVQRSSAQ